MKECENVSKRLGNSLGHRWRTEIATLDQASKLRDLWSNLTNEGSWDLWFAKRDDFTPGERLFFVLSPEHRRGHLAAYLFWREFGDAADPAHTDFVQGFAEGALGLDTEGQVDEESLRKVVRAAMELEQPTLKNIVNATGISEDCAGRLLHAAETFGFVTYEQLH
jgi:hypothetical protein